MQASGTRFPRRSFVLWTYKRWTGVRLLGAVQHPGLTETKPLREPTPNTHTSFSHIPHAAALTRHSRLTAVLSPRWDRIHAEKMGGQTNDARLLTVSRVNIAAASLLAVHGGQLLWAVVPPVTLTT
jgi:hypothetical protein